MCSGTTETTDFGTKGLGLIWEQRTWDLTSFGLKSILPCLTMSNPICYLSLFAQNILDHIHFPRAGRKRLTIGLELSKILPLVVLATLTSCKITLTLGNIKIS